MKDDAAHDAKWKTTSEFVDKDDIVNGIQIAYFRKSDMLPMIQKWIDGSKKRVDGNVNEGGKKRCSEHTLEDSRKFKICIAVDRRFENKSENSRTSWKYLKIKRLKLKYGNLHTAIDGYFWEGIRLPLNAH